MEFKGSSVLFCVVLGLYCVQNAFAYPRDTSVQKTEEIIPINGESLSVIPKVETGEKGITTEAKPSYGRVSCQFDEATEDPVCAEHCLPKGYSYGLCVGKICSCV